MRKFLISLGIALLALGLGFVYLKYKNQNSSGEPTRTPLQVEALFDKVIDQKTNTEIINISKFPDEIEVAPNTVFGSSDQITSATISPNGKWLAISVRGAAHDFGWLYNRPEDRLFPVVFQYGGKVTVESWRFDSRYVVFATETPVPNKKIKIVDTENIGKYPSDSGFDIEILDAEKNIAPEDLNYEFLEWHDKAACFVLAEKGYCIDPEAKGITFSPS